MATATNNMNCGCGMRSHATQLDHNNSELLSERLWDCQATENNNRHQCLTWWCNASREMEWMCLETGLGRSCDTHRKERE